MNFKEVIAEINKYYPLRQLNTDWFIYKDNIIVIAVIPYDTEQYHYAGKILAESTETFDKWSTCYYEVDIPTNRLQLNKVLLDLKEIVKPEHIEKSNNFEKYRS